MRSVFRKAQEKGQTKTTDTAETARPVIESDEHDPRQSESDIEAHAGLIETGESNQNAPPVQGPTSAVFSNKPVQRSAENVAVEAPPQETETIMRKSQARPSSPVRHKASVEARPRETQAYSKPAEETLATSDQESAVDHLPEQAIPLESVWNVQRVETTESRVQEPIPPLGAHYVKSLPENKPNGDDDSEAEIESPLEVDYVKSLPGNQPNGDEEPEAEIESTVFREEQEYPPKMDKLSSAETSDSPRTPVEILPPSRPRPRGTSVLPSRPAVQKRPDNKAVPAEMNESSFVNTAIGPLPADLWSLLGQKPPMSSHQPEMHVETQVSFSQEQPSNAQSTIASQHTFAPREGSRQATHLPTVIQREALPEEPSMPASQESDQSPGQKEDPAQSEPDLDDLAHKVYAEVRRRLAREWERARWHY